jgi:hypothetical protein
VSSPTAQDLSDVAADKVTLVTLQLNLDTRTLIESAASNDAISLAAASVRVAMDEPNKAVTVLVGAALENMAANLPDHATLALGAAVHLLRGVAASQLLGIVQ